MALKQQRKYRNGLHLGRESGIVHVALVQIVDSRQYRGRHRREAVKPVMKNACERI